MTIDLSFRICPGLPSFSSESLSYTFRAQPSHVNDPGQIHRSSPKEKLWRQKWHSVDSSDSSHAHLTVSVFIRSFHLECMWKSISSYLLTMYPLFFDVVCFQMLFLWVWPPCSNARGWLLFQTQNKSKSVLWRGKPSQLGLLLNWNIKSFVKLQLKLFHLECTSLFVKSRALFSTFTCGFWSICRRFGLKSQSGDSVSYFWILSIFFSDVSLSTVSDLSAILSLVTMGSSSVVCWCRSFLFEVDLWVWSPGSGIRVAVVPGSQRK